MDLEVYDIGEVLAAMAIVPISEVQEMVVQVVPITPSPMGVEMTIECTP